MKKFLSIFAIIILSFLLASCSKKENPVSSSTNGTKTIPPTNGIIFQSNTVNLTNEAGKISSITSTSISFSSGDAAIKDLKVGDVFVCGISDKTPHGTLRKITGIQKTTSNEGAFSFITTMVGLNKLIKKGKLPFDVQVFSLNKNINAEFENSGSFGASLNGTLYNVGRLSGFLNFDGTGQMTSKLDFNFSGNLNVNFKALLQQNINLGRKDIAYIPLPPIPIWADPPIILTPNFYIYVGLKGEFAGSVSSGINDNFNSTLIADYNGSSWTSEKPTFTNNFSLKEFKFNFSSDVKLYLGSGVDFLVYETTGPRIGVEPYVRFYFGLNQNPLWKASWGLAATMGLSSGWLDNFVPSPTLNFPISETEFAHALISTNNPPSMPLLIAPSNGNTNVTSPVTLQWSKCSDPDGDPVTYDLHIWPLPNNKPVWTTGLTQNSYYLGDIPANTQVVWEVYSNDGKDSTGGGLWYFTVPSSSGGGTNGSIFTDPRDGHQYKIIIIDGITIMAQNFSYHSPSSVYYENNSSYAEYGRLYTWQEAKDYAPAGWRLPTLDELYKTQNYLGYPAGGKLKETGTAYWKYPNQGATNETGFSALGSGDYNNGAFESLTEDADFWTSTPDPNVASFHVGFGLNYDSDRLFLNSSWSSGAKLAVRYVKK